MRLFRRDGRLFLTCSFGDNWTAIYRFDGNIAVPAAMFSKGGPNDFPPHNPYRDRAWMWVDRNGDGEFQAEEFQPIAPGGLDVFRAQYVDEQGAYWLGEQGTRQVHCFPIVSFTSRGVPLYSPQSQQTKDLAAIDPDVQALRDIKYAPASDTLFACVYSRQNPKGSNWVAMGREIRRYDHWSKGPVLGLTIVLPFDDPGMVLPISQSVRGDYDFVAFMNGADPAHRATGEIYVYRVADGKLMGTLRPTKEVGSRSGWIDFQTGAINARRLPDGAYVVFAEEDARAKILYYEWKPGAGP